MNKIISVKILFEDVLWILKIISAKILFEDVLWIR